MFDRVLNTPVWHRFWCQDKDYYVSLNKPTPTGVFLFYFFLLVVRLPAQQISGQLQGLLHTLIDPGHFNEDGFILFPFQIYFYCICLIESSIFLLVSKGNCVLLLRLPCG